jgi:hypothetical protein
VAHLGFAGLEHCQWLLSSGMLLAHFVNAIESYSRGSGYVDHVGVDGILRENIDRCNDCSPGRPGLEVLVCTRTF